MRKFAILRLMAIAMGMAGAFSAASVWAQEEGACGGIAADLAAAIESDRAKALMLLEDALVINEGCAGDIVRSALLAVEGDAEMARQVVETATNVAPKMVAVIQAAAGISAPAPAVAATAEAEDSLIVSGEGDKIVTAVSHAVSEEEDLGFGFSGVLGANLRGVYLVQPPPSGMPSSDLLRKYANISTSPCSCTP